MPEPDAPGSPAGLTSPQGTDVLTPEQRRLNMSRIRGKNTRPEMTVRRLLHAAGFRYRLHGAGLPGKPDLVLPKYRAVIFVHGCFWHGHTCPLFRWPATRKDFWEKKIHRNMERDAEAAKQLQALGWRVFTIWECALRGRSRRESADITAAVALWLQGLELTGTLEGRRKESEEQ